MTSTTRILLMAATAACLPLAAPAAGPEPAPTPEAYRSAFEGYRPFAAGEVQDWRKSNDTVREIGGWRAYAREIQQADRQGAAPDPRGEAVPGGTGPSKVQPEHSR